MDKYHVYGVLGSGKHSKVYKARQKKTIMYYAIKSVEISQKDRVLQEIETMHALQHSHVLRYYQCYETRSSIWLVLEYCVGGDLKALLEKDRQLEEDAIHTFARGLVESLQYCHSQAVIYGDLKPSNLLLDENGKIKLGGFGLSKRLADIEATVGQPAKVAPKSFRKGTPAYMAPELFRHGSVYSSCSDLWALGCVLYECRAGRPPFSGPMLQHLINDIETAEPPELDASPQFRDLVGRLLDKNPATRMTWRQLSTHAFWKEPIAFLPLPQERAMADFIAHHNLKLVENQVPNKTNVIPGESALRVSRAVRSNLQADAGSATVYGGATPGEGTEDVRLHTPDAEVDFDERASDSGNSDASHDAAGGATGSIDDSARDGAASGPEQASHTAAMSGLARMTITTSPAVAAMAQQKTQQRQRNLAQHNVQQENDAGMRSGGNPKSTPSRAPLVATKVTRAAAEAGSIAALIWHSSDNVISSIVNNPRIEKLPQAKFDVQMLAPVPNWNAAQLASLPDAVIQDFLLRIYKALGDSAPISKKINVLAYMEAQLCTHSQSADMLINSKIGGLLVQLLRGATVSGKASREKDSLRARIAGVLGHLLRHAVSISPTLTLTGIVDVLTVAAADKSEKVQRRAAAALGELLFYISDKDPSAGRDCVDGWVVPSGTVDLMTHLLHGGTQEVVQHYAAHTIENIVLQGGPWVNRFADDTLLSNLVTLWSTSKDPALRETAASALSRLVRHAPAQLSMLITTFGTRILVAGLDDPSDKIQTACANILAIALASHQLGAITRATLRGGAVQNYGAMQGALKLMESDSPTLRAKGCLLLALLVHNDPCALATACLLGLPTAADGVARDQHRWDSVDQAYVAAGIDALCGQIATAVPHILDQLVTMTESATNTAVASRLRVSARDAGGTLFNFEKVVPALLANAELHSGVVSGNLVQTLATVLTSTAASVDTLSVDIKGEVLFAIEALFSTGGVATAVAHGPALAVHLAPALAHAGGGAPAADTRVQAISLLLDMLRLLRAMPPVRGSSSGGQGLVEEVESTVTKGLLPYAAALLMDEPPVPLYTQRLLEALLEIRTAWALTVARAGLVPAVIDFLDLQHPNNNVHNLSVTRLLILGGAIPPLKLIQLGVARQVVDVLAYIHGNRVTAFFESVLELSATLLSHYASSEGSQEVCSAFLPSLPIFIELVGSPDVCAASLAAKCVLSISELAPADARELLFSRDGASLVDAAMAASPQGASGDPARQHLMLALLSSGAPAYGAFTAEPGATRQLRLTIAKLPTGGSEMEAVAKSTMRMLSSLQ